MAPNVIDQHHTIGRGVCAFKQRPNPPRLQAQGVGSTQRSASHKPIAPIRCGVFAAAGPRPVSMRLADLKAGFSAAVRAGRPSAWRPGSAGPPLEIPGTTCRLLIQQARPSSGWWARGPRRFLR